MTTGLQAAAESRTALRQQVIRFAGVGIVSTVLHLGLFGLLVVAGMPSQLANGLSLVVATVANTAANRSWTFGVTGREQVVTHHGQALLVFAITWSATSAALWLLAALEPEAGAAGQTAVVAVANALSTVVRFVAMRSWIFRRDAA
jgi:putative flippase GtrA